MDLIEQLKLWKEQQKIEFSKERQLDIDNAEDYLQGKYKPLDEDYE